MGLLEGKVAIVTGAGGGIGREHAKLFAREGARVVVNDLGGSRDGSGESVALADAVVQEIVEAGGTAVANYDSVTVRDGVDRLVWTAINKFKRIDILVNNAGILRDRSLLNMSEEEWDKVQEVHLRGTFLCTQAVARLFKQQGHGGRIINTTSVSGLVGSFGQANYAAAKAGIAGFTFTCAQEFARFNVTVNAIAPIALTRMTDDLPMMDGQDDSSLGPQHVAPVALFLASELAANLSGKIIGVHGRKVFTYAVASTEGVTLEDDQAWTAEMIKERWGDIG